MFSPTAQHCSILLHLFLHKQQPGQVRGMLKEMWSTSTWLWHAVWSGHCLVRPSANRLPAPVKPMSCSCPHLNQETSTEMTSAAHLLDLFRGNYQNGGLCRDRCQPDLSGLMLSSRHPLSKWLHLPGLLPGQAIRLFFATVHTAPGDCYIMHGPRWVRPEVSDGTSTPLQGACPLWHVAHSAAADMAPAHVEQLKLRAACLAGRELPSQQNPCRPLWHSLLGASPMQGPLKPSLWQVGPSL